MTVTRDDSAAADAAPVPDAAGQSGGRGWPASALTLIGPLTLVYLATLIVSTNSASIQVQSSYALANLVIVVGLQLFVGNSGVLSFGHIAFVAVGAWTMGLVTIGRTLKKAISPDLFPFLAHASEPPLVAVVLAGIAGGLLALVVAPFLMRLNGLQAGIATFALLGVVTQVLSYWTKISPPSGQSMVGVPNALSLQGLLFIALSAIVVSWLYGRTRTARLLRASRENAVAAPGSGINITAHRVIAFSTSGVICGVGGAMWAETNGVVQASQLSTQFTFTVIAMLVLGGTLSLWGAVLGTMTYSIIDAGLQHLQGGWVIGLYEVKIPDGSRPVILGALLVLMLLFRPEGITRGHEFAIPGLRRRRTPPNGTAPG